MNFGIMLLAVEGARGPPVIEIGGFFMPFLGVWALSYLESRLANPLEISPPVANLNKSLIIGAQKLTEVGVFFAKACAFYSIFLQKLGRNLWLL